MFGIIYWKLWKGRNIVIFSNSSSNTYDVVMSSLVCAKGIHNNVYKTLVNLPPKLGEASTWSYPPQGWIKLNVDAIMNLSSNRACVGGVF